MSLNPTIVWFLMGLILTFLEFIVPGVILIFFGAGAWIVAVSTYIGITRSLESQVLLFSIASVVLLCFLRRWIRGKFHGYVSNVQDPTQNLNEFIGESVVVTKDVVPGRRGGSVEFKGAEWSAVSDDYVRRGEWGIITGLTGITLKIKSK